MFPPRPTDTECLENNGGTYKSTTGAVFDVFCYKGWGGNDIHLNFTTEYFSCINGCALWNTHSTNQCVGVTYGPGQYGPDGEGGGSQCYYKWVMPGSVGYSPAGDAARLKLEGYSPIPTVRNASIELTDCGS